MARTNIPLTNLNANGILDIQAGTTIDTANNMNVAFTTTGIPAATTSTNLFLYVTNTAGADKTVTIKAGDQITPAFLKDKGDLAVVCHTATGGGLIGPLETGRFLQSGAQGTDQPAGSINVNFASGHTGTVTAYILPERF